MNARIISKMTLDFGDYQIVGRVYSLPGFKNQFAVVVGMYADGNRYLMSRDTIGGLHCARKTMMEMASDLHGNA